MKVRIIEPYHSPAMQRWAGPIISNFNTVDLCDEPDINYFIPWHDLAKGKSPSGLDVMFYTHVNPGMEDQLTQAVTNADAIICMSESGVREIKEICPRGKPVRCIYPYVDGFNPRKLRVGIVGAEQPNGRKGSHQLIDLAWKMDMDPFMFCIVGTGWEYTVEKLKNMGVMVDYHQSIPNLANFYAEMDLILCTGFTEGGPLPLIEALACGKPVLAPPGGLGADIGLMPYHNIEQLIGALKGFVVPIQTQVDSVSHMNLATFVEDHRQFFSRLLDEPINNRYEHVDRIVAETGATRLMEIGTWTGQRALSMIRTAHERNPESPDYIGFDLFELANHDKLVAEGTASKPPPSANSVFKKLDATGAGLSIIRGDTKTTLGQNHNRSTYDFIFIDGGHSWETIENDWKEAQNYAHDGTVFLLDDYYYNDPDEVKGIGCQKLVQSLMDKGNWIITMLSPVETWPQPWGELKIGMVRIEHGDSN